MAGNEPDEFYLRYYVGHKGKFGHEFLEFEFRPDGKLRYANNSNYKNDTMIRKEVFLTPPFSIMKEDDNNWPEPDRSSKDPEGLRIFYYLVQEHFKLVCWTQELESMCKKDPTCALE
ncbi:hypothetical protein HPP92_020272 [Vanilla planifolia]|uniref:Uncharacterized protein n=1 Tax=Vanilla planifolia TaxID=51239 RepID=A0A835PXE6_VANPL|nr:hypothetical protein HPP92_020677 [Vanilla planifolia]KAG0461796.1 hypothetical protein HPP92_020272 [Vanilla planifolia]